MTEKDFTKELMQKNGLLYPDEKRVLILKCNVFANREDLDRMEREISLKIKRDDGVIVLPNTLQFCALAAADEVYLMRDDMYQCDPKKAAECKKSNCYLNGGECMMTTRKEWRR